MKKLLLSIGISILITSFIGTTFLFVRSVNGYAEYILGGYIYNKINVEDIQENNIVNEVQEEIMTFEDYKLEGKEYDYVVGKTMEEMLNRYEEQTNKENGEDFPAVGYLVTNLLLYYPSMIVRVYLISIISGIIIGCIVDLLFIKKIKGKKLILFFIIFFAIFFILIRGLDVFDNMLLNIAYGNNVTDSIMSSYQYGITEIFIGYSVLFVLLCFICIIHQKFIAKRLNQELKK